jgi:hypothetical protein
LAIHIRRTFQYYRDLKFLHLKVAILKMEPRQDNISDVYDRLHCPHRQRRNIQLAATFLFFDSDNFFSCFFPKLKTFNLPWGLFTGNFSTYYPGRLIMQYEKCSVNGGETGGSTCAVVPALGQPSIFLAPIVTIFRVAHTGCQNECPPDGECSRRTPGESRWTTDAGGRTPDSTLRQRN